MAKDPAFLFYPGDYLRDTQCLSEAAQVAYDRIMCEHMRNICISQAQLDFFTKRLTADQKSEVEMVLKKVDGGYQITWVAESITKRRDYSESRRNNRSKTKKTSSSYVSHMENENEIVNEIEDAVKKRESEGKTNASRETDLPNLDDYNNWTEQMVDGNDMYFQTMLRNDNIPTSENLLYWIHDHRDLLNRYPKMRPPNQQAFRQSCLKHVRENYKKTFNGTAAGTNKKQQHTANAAQYVADHYAAKLNGGRGKPHG